MNYNVLHYMLDLPYEMEWDQVEDIGLMYEGKKLILNHETGTGKTTLALGVTALLASRLRKENRKLIITAPSNKLDSFKEDVVSSVPALRVMRATGKADDVNWLIKYIDDYDVIVTMPSLWASVSWAKFVYEHPSKILCSIYDEAAGINDEAYHLFCEFSRQQFEYSFLLNATPVKRSNELEKTYNLLYAVEAINDGYTFRDFQRDMVTLPSGIGNKKALDIHGVVDEYKFHRLYSKYILNRSKADLGVNVEVEVEFYRCSLSKIQEDVLEAKFRKSNSTKTVTGKIETVTEILYNPQDLYQVNPVNMEALSKTMMMTLQELQNINTTNVVVFMQNTDIKNRFQQMLNNMGINTFMIDGSLKPAQKNEVEKAFNESEKSVMITNIEKASSFQSANVILIYGFPEDIIQTTNRIIRGRSDKKVKVHWVYYGHDSFNKLLKQLELTMEDEKISKRTFPCTIPIYKEITKYYDNPALSKFHAILKGRDK